MFGRNRGHDDRMTSGQNGPLRGGGHIPKGHFYVCAIAQQAHAKAAAAAAAIPNTVPIRHAPPPFPPLMMLWNWLSGPTGPR